MTTVYVFLFVAACFQRVCIYIYACVCMCLVYQCLSVLNYSKRKKLNHMTTVLSLVLMMFFNDLHTIVWYWCSVSFHYMCGYCNCWMRYNKVSFILVYTIFHYVFVC